MAVKLLRSAALAAAAAHVAALVYLAVGRLLYPYELEWIEGGLVDEVRALLRGGALYAPPSARQVAFVYPPLYFYASAAAARLLGGGFLPLRLVSFAATGACLALMVALARRGGAGWAGGLLAAGLFAATFEVGAGWLTLARVDALCLAFLLAGTYAVLRAAGPNPPSPPSLKGKGGANPWARVRSSGWRYAAAGLLFALACLTKQSALPLALLLAAYAAYADRRRGWLMAATLGAAALGASALFNWATGGWYGYYVVTAALAQRLAGGASLLAGTAAARDLAGLAALAVLALLGCLASSKSRPGAVGSASAPAASAWRPRTGFWLTLGAGTAGTVGWVQLHQGAIENNRLPLLAVLAVLAGLASHGGAEAGAEGGASPRLYRGGGDGTRRHRNRSRVHGLARREGADAGAEDGAPPRLYRRATAGALPHRHNGAADGTWPGRRQWVVYGLALLAFGLLAYNPLQMLPTAANRAAAQALAQRLAVLGGSRGVVWVPQHGGLDGVEGAHLAAMDDVLVAGGPPADELLADARAALRGRQFAAIVVDGPDFARRFPELEQAYAAAGVAAEGEAFYNVAGTRTLPEILYLPKPP